MSIAFFEFPAQKSEKARNRVRFQWLSNLQLVWWALVFGLALWFCISRNGRSCRALPVWSYLFLLSALAFPWRGPAAPTAVPPAPTGPAKAPFPPGWTGELPHLPLRAAHRDAFVTVQTVCFQSQNHKNIKTFAEVFSLFFFFPRYRIIFILLSITH